MKIMNVRATNVTISIALNTALSLIDGNSTSTILFLNEDCLYKAQYDKEYRNILNSADLVLPDGIGLKIAARILGVRIKDNCNGTDFSPLFLKEVAKKGYKVFFLGSKEGVAEKAAKNFMKKIPGLKIVGWHSGFFENDGQIIRKINASKADILFVGMGVPLQEKWIFRNREKLKPRLCLGVGALFDYNSGHIKRAPKIFRVMRLEWFWRLMLEPKRMFKRYIIDGSKLFILVLKARIRGERVQ